MRNRTSPRIAILGAGPIGLEAGLYARQLKLPFTIYEQGRVGEHVWRWGHVKLFSPFGMNATPLGRKAIQPRKLDHAFPADDACISGREHVERYLAPLARGVARPHQDRDDASSASAGSGFFKQESPGDRGPREAAVPAARAREEPGALRGSRRRARLHRHLFAASLARPRRHPRARRSAGGAAHRLWPGRCPRRRQDAITSTNRCSSSAPATRRRRRSATSPSSPRSTTRPGSPGSPAHAEHAAVAAHPQRSLARARSPRRRTPTTWRRATTTTSSFAPTPSSRRSSRCQQPGLSRHASDRRTARRRSKSTRSSPTSATRPTASLYRELQIHECYASFGPMKLAAAAGGQQVAGLPEAGLPRPRLAAQSGAELLHPRRQELWPQLAVPDAHRLRAGARRVHADHGGQAGLDLYSH